MFLMLLRLLVISVLTRSGSHGWTLHNHHRRKVTGSDIENRLRQVRSSGGLTAVDFSDRSRDEDSELKLKHAIEALMNQTQKNNEDSRHAFGRIPLSGSQPQELGFGGGPPGRGMIETMSHAAITSIMAGARSTPPDSKRPSQPPPLKHAKQFWNHFAFRRRSESQETIVPIKTTAVQQQTCRALPFLQSVVHENCEKVVLKNNLCFGRCSSVHVPGNEDRTYTICSYCVPTNFTTKTVELKCKGSVSVTKLVMLVEECQCEAKKGRPPQLGPFLLDPSLGIFTNQA